MLRKAAVPKRICDRRRAQNAIPLHSPNLVISRYFCFFLVYHNTAKKNMIFHAILANVNTMLLNNRFIFLLKLLNIYNLITLF